LFLKSATVLLPYVSLEAVDVVGYLIKAELSKWAKIARTSGAKLD